jgi:hypothetical protein
MVMLWRPATPGGWVPNTDQLPVALMMIGAVVMIDDLEQHDVKPAFSVTCR